MATTLLANETEPASEHRAAEGGDDGSPEAQATRVSQLLKQIEAAASAPPLSQQDEARQRSYRDRVRSYTPLTHFAKPPSLSPLVCSLFGWRNVGPNMLTCDECQQALALIYLPTLSYIAHRKLTCLYEDQLWSGHKPTCSYRESAACYIQSAKAAAGTTCTTTTCTTAVAAAATDEAGAATADDDDDEEASAANSAESTANRDNLAPRVATAAAVPTPLTDLTPALIVPTLLEGMFTREDLQLLDHAYPVRPFFNLVQSFQESIRQMNNNSNEQQQQQPPLQWQLPKLDTTESFLAYNPSDQQPADHLLLDESSTLLHRLVELLVTTVTGQDDGEESATSWLKGQSPTHVESLVALALLGWRPSSSSSSTTTAAAAAVATGEAPDASTAAGSADSSLSPTCAVFSLSCPLCLASISIDLVHALTGGSDDAISEERENQQQQQDLQTPSHNKNKRQRISQSPSRCNPVKAHKYYCPYTCGFPINGAQEAKPLWQGIADRLLLAPRQSLESQNDAGQSTTSSTQPAGAWERIHNMLVSGIAPQKNSIVK